MEPINPNEVSWQSPQTNRTETSSGLDWTKYSSAQLSSRLKIIATALQNDALSLQRAPETGNTLKALAISFAYALEEVPSCHLAECLQRAIAARDDGFPLKAPAVMRAWREYIPELQAIARQGGRLLQFPGHKGEQAQDEDQDQGERMGPREWKARHNLPDNWRPTDGASPDSDLAHRVRE